MTPEDVATWLAAHPQLAITILTAILGTGGAARHYRRTGKLPLSTLPWRSLRRIFYLLRRKYATKPRPRKRPYHVQDTTLDDVRTRLGEESYEPGWPFSWNYYSEDLNARRYYLDREAEYPHRQLHIRGFELEDGTVELLAHEEPAPKHHPKAHLKGWDMHNAVPWLQEAWDGPALDPRHFEAPA